MSTINDERLEAMIKEFDGWLGGEIIYALKELQSYRKGIKQAVEEIEKFAFGKTDDEYERAQQDGADHAIRVLDKCGLLKEE